VSTRSTVDLVVIGDGPAGSALAAAATQRGLSTVLVGPDADWSATYGCWQDDLDGLAGRLHPAGDAAAWFARLVPAIAVHAGRPRLLERPYGVLDNGALREDLRRGVEHRTAHVERVERAPRHHRVVLARGDEIEARLVVDAAGWPSRFAPEAARSRRAARPAWQTAVGVVLREPPAGDLGVPTLMDFRPARGGPSGRASTIGPAGVTSFAYALPVDDGWLVEETVLAARPAVEPVALLARLASRLGRHPDDVLADAVRTEFVRIPMGGPLPSSDQAVVAFGAAAGYIHPATGYSVGASLRAVPRAVDGIEAAATTSGIIDAALVWESVWPTAQRRTRVFHDYGLETLMRLDGVGVAAFFDAFFGLPVDRWAAYLRIDTPPAETARVMSELFTASPWHLRRKLALANPTALARLLRP
jgi:lycopene beta-cyclase